MHGSIDSWSYAAALAAALLIIAEAYTRGCLRLHRTAPTLPVSLLMWRAGALVLGLGALWIAVAPPIGAVALEQLSVHMVQHILLGTIAPPLIWLSAPIMPILSGLPRSVGRLTRSAIASGALEPFGRVVTHPSVAWLAGVLTLVGWHMPAVFDAAQHSAFWHSIQNASFFVTGLLFWWPVVQPWPAVARLSAATIPLYLFAATLPCDALSAFLVFCDRLVYPQHAAAHASIVSALADQQTAGAIMWMSVTLLYLVPAVVVTMHALSPKISAAEDASSSISHRTATP
jgi:putative membrane protein